MMIFFRYRAPRLTLFSSVSGVFLTLTLLVSASVPNNAQAYTNEDLARTIKPAIVRIVMETRGSISITAFSFDFERLTIIPHTDRAPIIIPLPDAVLTSGSGFVINPKGYILTNAHVVSDQMLKNEIVYPYLREAFMREALRQSAVTRAHIESAPVAVQEQFVDEVYSYAMEQAKVSGTQIVRVLDPSTGNEAIDGFWERAFPARVISVAKNSYKTGRDAAIIKIEVENLPSISLASRSMPSVGEEVFLFGFPGTGDFSGADLIEATLTAGVISALKEAPTGDFKLLQTDAKSSQGSSGGPLIDRLGRVIGILTYGTGGGESVGDGFGFAIPAEVGSTLLGENAVVSETSIFVTEAARGFELFNQARCKDAQEAFTNAELSVNKKFVPSGYFDEYRAECDRLIAAGLSIDNSLSAFKEGLRGVGTLSWITFGGLLSALVLLSVAMIHLFRRLQRSESELDLLEHHLDTEGVSGIPETFKNHGYGSVPWSTLIPKIKNKPAFVANTELPIPLASIPLMSDPIGEYVRTTRASGTTDQVIRQSLLGAGWDETSVERGMGALA